ncbi:MAG: DUF4383 domain-containing protein [Actinomycetota bacterium]|nr:DUF4383 domain-containing protein [Actinomycetota bacterium]
MEERLPLDSPLNAVYRSGGAFGGVVLLVFGVLGFIRGLPFFTTHGEKVIGLYSNGLLSALSVLFGLVLLGAAVIGGNVAASVNAGGGVLLLFSGLANLALIRTDANFLAFRMNNIFFSFVLGLILLVCGLYGRVGTGDPAGDRAGHRTAGSPSPHA